MLPTLITLLESPLQVANFLYPHHVSVFLHTFHDNVLSGSVHQVYLQALMTVDSKVKMKSFPILSVIYSSISIDVETFVK